MTFPSPEFGRLRRRRAVQRAVLIGVLLLLLIVSALLWPRQRSDALAVATTDRPVSAGGVLSGTLAATKRGDHVCYAVRTDDATAPLVLPKGWAAEPRLGLLDPSGTVVAQPGDDVRLTGRPGRTGTVPGCTDRGRVWTVATVRLD